jgi:hypothetical protein
MRYASATSTRSGFDADRKRSTRSGTARIQPQRGHLWGHVLGRDVALRERRARIAVIQSRSEALTGIIGARRAWTVSMISPLSMPWR